MADRVLRCAVCWTADHATESEAITILFGWALCPQHGFIRNEYQFWLEVDKMRELNTAVKEIIDEDQDLLDRLAET